MPFHIVSLFDVLLGLRGLVFGSNAAADSFDRLECPGLFSGYCAATAYQCWASGELPLWAAAQGGGLEQVAWRPGSFIDWPDTTCDVAIAEYRGAGLIPHLMGEGDPPVYRRENIATSTAGARRLRAFVRAEVKKKIPKGVTGATAAEIEKFLRTQGKLSEGQAGACIEKNFGRRKPPRSQWRPVLTALHEDAAFKPATGRPPRK